MAPFLIKHPILIHRWVLARETALARVRALEGADEEVRQAVHRPFATCLAVTWRFGMWMTKSRWNALASCSGELKTLNAEHEGGRLLAFEARPWDQLYRQVEAEMSQEAQELIVSLLIELYPERVDDLAEQMATSLKEHSEPAKPIGALQGTYLNSRLWLGAEHRFCRPKRAALLLVLLRRQGGAPARPAV